MTTYALLIPPTGVVERITERADMIGLAHTRFGDATYGIDMCAAPDRQHVLAVDGDGVAKQLPRNLRAWAMCGRSMLHGAVLLWRDDRGPLDDDVVAFVEGLDEGADPTPAATGFWQARLGGGS